jgi:FtsH-binding integral membrane protein
MRATTVNEATFALVSTLAIAGTIAVAVIVARGRKPPFKGMIALIITAVVVLGTLAVVNAAFPSSARALANAAIGIGLSGLLVYAAWRWAGTATPEGRRLILLAAAGAALVAAKLLLQIIGT